MRHPFQDAIKIPWVLGSIAIYESTQPKNIQEFTKVSADVFSHMIDKDTRTIDVAGLLITLHCLWKFWAHGTQSFELTESLALALALTDPGDIEWALPYDAFWIGFGGAEFEKLTEDFVKDEDIVNIDEIDDLTYEDRGAGGWRGLDNALDKSVHVYGASGDVNGYTSKGCYVSRVTTEDGSFEVNVHAIDPAHGITSGIQLMVGESPNSPLGRLLKNLCLYLSTPEAETEAISKRAPKNQEMLAKAVKTINLSPARLESLAPWLAKKTKPSVTRVGGNNELGEATGSRANSLRGAHWVRGHWRKQWYGSEDARCQRPKWIRPHKRGGVPDEGIRTYEVQP